MKKELKKGIRKQQINVKSQNLVIFAILTLIISIALAIYCYPFLYSPYTNWISDLGNPLLNSGAIYFNWGIIITGFILAILFTRAKSPLITIFGIVMSIFLTLVGFCPENNPILHSFNADIFFKAIIICSILILLSIKSFSIKIFGIITISTTLYFLIFAFEPFFEWVSFCFSFIFICITLYSY